MKTLLLVYNAAAGLGNALLDYAHKLLSPATYPCHLCALTHHHFGPTQAFQDFLKTSPFKLEILHKDEFESVYQQSIVYPAILLKPENGQLQLIFSSDQIRTFKTFEELRSALGEIDFNQFI